MGDTLFGEKRSDPTESVEEVKRKCKGQESRFGKRYGFEAKLRRVKSQLEEGLPVSLLCKEVKISKDVVYRRVKTNQEGGEETFLQWDAVPVPPSVPNQVCQEDISVYRLAGRYAYLIGFIDGYSRYIAGLEQTSIYP